MSYKLGKEYERLRDYQLDCVTDVFDTFNSGTGSTICVLPMSAGKTVIVGAIMHNYLKNMPMKRAIMLSHLDVLTRQNEESLREFWDLDTGILQAQNMPKNNSNCIVSTMQSFSIKDKVERWGKLDSIGLCVIDECHLHGSRSYDDIVAMLPDDCLLLGVTATPFRDNRDMSNMFDTVSYTISMQELIDRGQLVPPKLNYIAIPDADDVENIHKTILSIYTSKHKGEKTIVFLKGIKECEQLEKLARAVGISAKAITSKVTGDIRDNHIQAFKSNADGSADMLITVNVLTAGFSSNNVRSIFMPYKISSVAAYLQRIGRGMRLDGPDKKYVDVYVGGESPVLVQEFYEKVQRQALTAGRAEREEEFDLDLLPPVLDDTSITYDAETAKLHKELKSSGFQALAEMITTVDFPPALLEALVTVKKCTHKKLTASLPSTIEANFLERNGIKADNMNALESRYASSALLETKGVHKDRLYVSEGKLAGKPYIAVTNMQKKFIPNAERGRFYQGLSANKALYSALDLM